ncbi:unnamed protein product [Acanthosepion pharaonis]|uniref:Uncharacterized protein n=1 Tax=Acanthosepion pharaonis TaxID=158019 RepID=A0A812ATP7_ACAPH|nr:unnamed protein product [Sepia pharaonis]
MNAKPFAGLFKPGNCFSSTLPDRCFFYVRRLIYSKTRVKVFDTFVFRSSLHSVAKTSCCSDGEPLTATAVKGSPVPRTVITVKSHPHAAILPLLTPPPPTVIILLFLRSTFHYPVFIFSSTSTSPIPIADQPTQFSSLSCPLPLPINFSLSFPDCSPRPISTPLHPDNTLSTSVRIPIANQSFVLLLRRGSLRFGAFYRRHCFGVRNAQDRK